MTPIGFARSDFREKFGTPRQPALAPAARADIVLCPPFARREALRGLEGFSHAWIIFGFHLARVREWSPTVRPPRLGGNRRIGVFASRSPFRPNALGLSVVALVGTLPDGGDVGLRVSGQDFVDGTPVYDIKPYLAYADALPWASAPEGFDRAPPPLPVTWSEDASTALAALDARRRALIEQALALDPRPAYRRGEGVDRRYGVSLAGLEVRWCVRSGVILVESVEPL